MKVPFALPGLGKEEIEEVVAVIKSGWLTTGSRCAQFERDFAGLSAINMPIQARRRIQL